MSIYAVDKLMAETRRLAAEYYKTTQQTLPVSGELAKYDASRILTLHPPETVESGVDAVNQQGQKIQIKSRVLFKERYDGYRIGQLNLQARWDKLILLLMDAQYQPVEIYENDRQLIADDLASKENPNRQKRGVMSVAKFIALGQLIWSMDQGLEPGTCYTSS